MSWTPEKVEKTERTLGKGHTASQIAEKLGDTTRNAVIGKAHRLNLEARAPSKKSSSISSPTKSVRRPIQQMTRKQKFQSILLDKNFEAEKPKSLEELTLKIHANGPLDIQMKKFLFLWKKAGGRFSILQITCSVCFPT